jgi:hypothetical protein
MDVEIPNPPKDNVDYVLPGYDGAPLGELNQTYQPNYPSLEAYWTVFDNGNPQSIMFTAIFTCPLTVEHFASGDFGDAEKVVRIGNVYWYSK